MPSEGMSPGKNLLFVPEATHSLEAWEGRGDTLGLASLSVSGAQA